MNHLEKNAIALNDEQRRIRDIVSGQATKITRLESEVLALRQEINTLRGLTMTLIGRGATDAHR